MSRGPAAPSRLGLGRLVTLLLLLGLVGMHGMASTASGGAHRLQAHAAAASGISTAPMAGDHVDSPAAAVLHGSGVDDGAGSHDGGHSVLVGCVFVLAGLVLTVLLGVLARVRRLPVAGLATLAPRGVRAPPDPPPRRPRISLCVLRV